MNKYRKLYEAMSDLTVAELDRLVERDDIAQYLMVMHQAKALAEKETVAVEQRSEPTELSMQDKFEMKKSQALCEKYINQGLVAHIARGEPLLRGAPAHAILTEWEYRKLIAGHFDLAVWSVHDRLNTTVECATRVVQHVRYNRLSYDTVGTYIRFA